MGLAGNGSEHSCFTTYADSKPGAVCCAIKSRLVPLEYTFLLLDWNTCEQPRHQFSDVMVLLTNT